MRFRFTLANSIGYNLKLSIGVKENSAKEVEMNTFALTESQQKRLERLAHSIQRTPNELLSGLIQEHIEELLEDLEDGAVATEVMHRVKTGEEKTFTLDELLELYQYQEDNER